ncbi:MAG: single-stranded DNA-binding protein [Thermodesulfobacteriota bacterium]
MSYNKIILVGNLTKTPEAVGQGSTTICNFSLAINRKYKSGDEQKEEVSYFDVVAFGKQADVILQFLAKGSQVLIDGRLQQQRWDDKETGIGRSKVVIVAERVQFLDKKPKVDQAPAPEEQQHDVPIQQQLGGDNVPF